jgi:hypothetical protein
LISFGVISFGNRMKIKKISFIEVEYVMSPKRSRGLGIEVPELKNKCLISKWLFKLLTEDGVWQQFLYNKYL